MPLNGLETFCYTRLANKPSLGESLTVTLVINVSLFGVAYDDSLPRHPRLKGFQDARLATVTSDT